ncbi:Abi family protein [Fructobacillus durionis]|uniref:Abortive infection bacteriophage resistance protein n=1 Tax=Fructobacillus durionis TaxID=283737 RepID=A0A1I1FJL1_9LACO|nr:Abi family protein [Fructobacillus durionis]SFB99166.1 Abortive infection bacteriophage resistance protein [Fructobacillus durionis]
MIETTTFLDWERQLQSLQEQYNISIQKKDTALRTLKKYSFHNLIDKYQDSLRKGPDTETFIDGISIETLGVIQMLENRLASEILQAILSIEKNMKSVFQYELAQQFGTLESNYLSNVIYSKRGQLTKQVLHTLHHKNQQSKNVSKTLLAYRLSGNVPPWILIENISFGQFNCWFQISPTNIREKVMTDFFIPASINEETLIAFQNTIDYLIDFRNGLAHGEAIVQIHSKAPLTLSYIRSFYEEEVITDEEFNEGYGQQDFFGLLLVIGILLKQSERQIFKDQLINLLNIFDSLLPINEGPMRHILGQIPINIQQRVKKII